MRSCLVNTSRDKFSSSVYVTNNIYRMFYLRLD
nr:MAG TPA: hypothetical protein [Caudoviricetes sp.]